VAFILFDEISGGKADYLGLDAANAVCKQKGWTMFTSTHSTVSGWPLWRTATVELKTAGNPPRMIRVELRKSLNLLGWRAVDYKEE
jgi:hypothetical protein